VALYSAALHALERAEDDAEGDISPGGNGDGTHGLPGTVNGVPPTRADLADAAAAALADLADATPNRGRKHQLLDQAARTRSWRWW
jgi:hypothetical protein